MEEERKYNPFIVASYGTLVIMWILSQKITMRYELQFYALIISVLYIACHLSLELLVEEPSGDDSDGKTRKAVEREVLRKEEALQFPLLASASIFTLYLALKYIDRAIVNMILSSYLGLMGCLALTATITPMLSLLIPPLEKMRLEKGVKLPTIFEKLGISEFSIDFSVADFLCFCFSGFVSVIYFKHKSWALNNVFGLVFCIQGIERFSIGNYKIGAILLSGLFFYDIFWVFGTDVMVTVAKGLDGPIKILFPKSLVPNEDSGKLEFSLLGLGDIVIPGFFLALLLRFDAYRFFKTCKDKVISYSVIHASFPKPYFHTTFAAYILGLVVTNLVMMYFKAAQPALLYLVPACLGASFLCAIIRGELKELCEYSEEDEEEDEKKDETTDGKSNESKKND